MKVRPGAGVPTFRISGTYPRTAFFDFATYGKGSYMKAIDAIADYQIQPSWVREVVRMHTMTNGLTNACRCAHASNGFDRKRLPTDVDFI